MANDTAATPATPDPDADADATAVAIHLANQAGLVVEADRVRARDGGPVTLEALVVLVRAARAHGRPSLPAESGPIDEG